MRNCRCRAAPRRAPACRRARWPLPTRRPRSIPTRRRGAGASSAARRLRYSIPRVIRRACSRRETASGSWRFQELNSRSCYDAAGHPDMSLRIIRPGLLSTVQDRGRHGLQHLGVVACGPMDAVALELANALVGNRSGEAAIEITVLGPEIAFESDALVAICGGHFDATLAGLALPLNRPVFIEKKSVVKTGRALVGSRAYLAVAGGIATAPVLGSRSTYLPARFGGLAGRLLPAGDSLPLIEDVSSLSLQRYGNLAGKKDAASLRTASWSAPRLT